MGSNSWSIVLLRCSELVAALSWPLLIAFAHSSFDSANSALQEYSKAVDIKSLGFPVYEMKFPGSSMYAKAARGAMVRHILKNKVRTPDGLQAFTGAFIYLNCQLPCLLVFINVTFDAADSDCKSTLCRKQWRMELRPQTVFRNCLCLHQGGSKDENQ